MNDMDENYCGDDTSQGSQVQVPLFPKRKLPTNSPKPQISSPSRNGSSTEDNSLSYSGLSKFSLNSSDFSNIFEHKLELFTEERQILSLIFQFKKANGIARRELECNIIRNLINQKKVIDQQEQYMISTQWTKDYTSYLYDNNSVKPKEIDNTTLFESDKIFKKGLCNTDFVLVNVSVWLFLKQEYSGGPDALFELYQQPIKPLRNQLLQLPVNSVKIRAKSQEIELNIQDEQPQYKSYEMSIVGFKNELYFCYMNSGLQSLLSLPDFTSYFVRTLESYFKEPAQIKYANIHMPTTLAYQELIDQIRQNKKDYIKVGTLRSIFSSKFNPRQQHDCQEFVLYLLSQIEDEVNTFLLYTKRIDFHSKNQENNIINYIFKGLIQSKVQCNHKSCMHSTSIVEQFLTLSIALKAQSLEECLDDFFKDEKLKDYKCEKCKRLTCLKKTFLQQQPKQLIFHIKRFKFFPKSHKLTQIVTFPLDNFSLQKYHNKQGFTNTYKLRALIVHQGNLDSGHYYSFGRRFHQVNKQINIQLKWFQFNDQSVRKVSKQDLQNQQAYLLFYTQNNSD